MISDYFCRMLAIAGKKRGTIVYHNDDRRYLSRLKYVRGGKAYFICCVAECSGRSHISNFNVVNEDGSRGTSFVQSRPHNHFPDGDAVDCNGLSEACSSRAMRGNTPPRQIYNEERLRSGK